MILIKQPPPRGCVLKPSILVTMRRPLIAAASARLCVETHAELLHPQETLAAASARLCVETVATKAMNMFNPCSRLRAAVC